MPTSRTRAARLLATTCALLMSLSCSASDEPQASPGCSPDELSTVTDGRLTLATGVVVRAPWVVDPDAPEGRSPDPSSGQGYDAAVGYALAERLGFESEQVTWVGRPFADAVAPGEKDFDVQVHQATISDGRRADVDLSVPYYAVRQAVVTLAGRAVAQAGSLADLRGARVAAVQGSPAARALEAAGIAQAVLRPELDEVRRAVSEATADALVTDYPTAMRFDADDTQLVGGELVGVLPAAEDAERYGLVLEKGSPLTPCVDRALEALRGDGTLGELEQRWLVEEPGWRDLR